MLDLSKQSWNKEGQRQRIEYIEEKEGISIDYLNQEKTFEDVESLRGNIENFIGFSTIPTALIGPVHVKGDHANGEFCVPFATTEGALSASYHRGMQVCNKGGGIQTAIIYDGINRSPLFRFTTLKQAVEFRTWLLAHVEEFKKVTKTQSSHSELVKVLPFIEGNQVIVSFEYTTGDAAGHNMVTFCTDANCHYILNNCPITPEYWFIESNFCGDKKARSLSFTSPRGKSVSAEIVLERELLKKEMKVSPEQVVDIWRSSAMASFRMGGVGVNAHLANGITAIFLACGQDVASIAEASVGLLRAEVNTDQNLYLSMTLPNLVVGTVGGGTHLSTQRECLEIMGCHGNGKAHKFAEICAATLLAGELSIGVAVANGSFTKAHKLFGRKRT